MGPVSIEGGSVGERWAGKKREPLPLMLLPKQQDTIGLLRSISSLTLLLLNLTGGQLVREPGKCGFREPALFIANQREVEE